MSDDTRVNLTKSQTEFFLEEFKSWQLKLGLKHIEIFFHVEDKLDTCYAYIKYSNSGVATLVLSKSFDYLGVPDVNEKLKSIAKHEAMHLLLGELQALAETRYVTSDEMEATTEKLVRVLQQLIN